MGLRLVLWGLPAAGTGLLEVRLSVFDSGTAGENVLGEATGSKREVVDTLHLVLMQKHFSYRFLMTSQMSVSSHLSL